MEWRGCGVSGATDPTHQAELRIKEKMEKKKKTHPNAVAAAAAALGLFLLGSWQGSEVRV